jgi:hypothetical protein
MLHVGLDLSRKRVDVCLISDRGELVDELAAPFDEDGLCRLTERVAAKHAGRVHAVVESMNGARFVHDTLEAQGWDVLVADARTSASAEGKFTPAYAPQCGSLRGGSRQCSCSSIALVSRGAAETAAWPRMRKRGGRVQPEPVRGLFVGG